MKERVNRDTFFDELLNLKLVWMKQLMAGEITEVAFLNQAAVMKCNIELLHEAEEENLKVNYYIEDGELEFSIGKKKGVGFI